MVDSMLDHSTALSRRIVGENVPVYRHSVVVLSITFMGLLLLYMQIGRLSAFRIPVITSDTVWVAKIEADTFENARKNDSMEQSMEVTSNAKDESLNSVEDNSKSRTILRKFSNAYQQVYVRNMTRPNGYIFHNNSTSLGSGETYVRDNNTNNSEVSSMMWYPSDEWLEACVVDLKPVAQEEGPWKNPWTEMAIGDCIKKCNCYMHRYNETAFNLLYARRCRDQPPNATIRFHFDKGNFGLVDAVQREQYASDPKRFTIPDEETLVIHLRLGDIIETSESTALEMLIHGGNPGHRPKGNYFSAIKSVHELLENIYESRAPKVHIIGGSHMNKYYEKSRIYAGCLYRAVQAAGFFDDVQMRVEGTHPEVDFYYISHAKKVVVSAGGYSNLMGRFAVKRGGKIVGRSFALRWG